MANKDGWKLQAQMLEYKLQGQVPSRLSKGEQGRRSREHFLNITWLWPTRQLCSISMLTSKVMVEQQQQQQHPNSKSNNIPVSTAVDVLPSTVLFVDQPPQLRTPKSSTTGRPVEPMLRSRISVDSFQEGCPI
jgi:hypothetical protein